MALLFMDGFEAGDYTLKWDGTNSVWATNYSPRVGTNTYYATPTFSSSSMSLYKNLTPTSSKLTFGMALRLNVLNSGNAPIALYSNSGNNLQFTLKINASGYVQIYRGSSTLLATGTTALPLDTWLYLELQVLISTTVGTAEVRINGATTPDITFSGNTQNYVTSNLVDQWYYSAYADLDDVYVFDANGTTNTTFAGDVRVYALLPNGNGSSSQFTGSDGDSTNNYQLVNEQPFSTSDYVGSATSGQRDTYAMADLPANVSTVLGAQNNVIVAKSDAGTASFKPALNIGGTLSYGPTRVLNTTYTSYRDIYDHNPVTSANWTVSDINGLEDGVEVV